MEAKYRTEAVNADGGDGAAYIVDGMRVAVSSPLGEQPDPDATNPEQLLALSWATCLNSTAQVIVARQRRTAVRVEVALVEVDPEYEFHVDAYVSAEGMSADETEQLAADAHSRCPVSKLLRDAATAQVHVEEYSAR